MLPELIDNKNKTLKDDLSNEIKSGSKLSIAAACFSIYAFQELKEVLSERQFKEAYDMLKEAKKRGDIKSSPWAELKRRERYITSVKQARVFLKAAEERYGEKFTLAEIYSMTPAQIHLLGDFINRTKDTGLYGGSYE